MAARPFHIATAHGRCFALHHPSATPDVRSRVLYVPPFAEEMNKSRRMAALTARALSAAGADVLQIDPHGTGDSSGEFRDATWQGWVDDIVEAARWLQPAADDAPLWLWSLRAGCLLAAEAAARLPTPPRLLFWQPAPAGRTVLQQFLRLKLASDLAGGANKGLIDGLKRTLAAGTPVEVGGYELPPAIAQGLEGAVLVPPAAASPLVPPAAASLLHWLEVSTAETPALLPASQTALQRWRDAGWAVQPQVLRGPAFWQTVEIEEAPALVAASVAAVCP